MIRWILAGTMGWFIGKITSRYRSVFPMYSDLCESISTRTIVSEKRLDSINKIKTNNIVTTLWSNIGLFLLIIALQLICFLFLFILLINTFDFSFLLCFLFIVISFWVTYLVLRVSMPHLIKKIVYHLPPEEYADISLNSLNDSGILTFTALKMWELCYEFIDIMRLPEVLYELANIDDPIKYKGFYINNKNPIKKAVRTLSSESDQYIAEYSKELNNIISLMKLASKKLDIQERELCNHIFKFSPYIFRKRVDTLRASTSTLRYIIESNEFERDDSLFVFRNTLREIYRIRFDVKHAGMRSLEQIILYDSIHTYLIGMSSIISTSRSLNIFCRGISETIFSRRDDITATKNPTNVDVSIEKLKSILHRSKAHYGMDLLVLLENFYKKSFTAEDKEYYLPEAIYRIKYPKRTEKEILSPKFSEMGETEIINTYQTELYNIRKEILGRYKKAIDEIEHEFRERLMSLDSKDGRLVFCLIGYSRIVRNVLKLVSKEIKTKKIITFVIKEDSEEMIDTQIFRFELNDEKPNSNIRKTFTASDQFFDALINPNDTVVFIAGIEAFDRDSMKLLHTNNYQKRINSLINSIKNKNRNKIKIWLLGGSYKIFNTFPPKESLFGNEFFSDHYDKIDLYDFKNYEEYLDIISNE